MAWFFGRYVEKVAAAGRAEYALPLYVNAALIRPGYQPGQYPSAGPLPHLIDVWRAAAPTVDFISPDIYFPNFAEWADRYVRERKSAVHPGSAAESRSVGEQPLRLWSEKWDRLRGLSGSSPWASPRRVTSPPATISSVN